MAGKLSISAFITALLVCACGTSPVTDLQRYQLKGDVLCEEVPLDGGSSYTAWFGRNGMLDSLIQVNPRETLSNVYSYDRRGRLKEHSIYRTDRHYEGYYLYNYKGNVLESYTLFGWDLQAIFDWKYDIEDGRQVRCRYYNEGALVSTTEYVYGKRSKMESVFDAEGAPCGEITYTYLDSYRLESTRSEDVDIRISYGEGLLPERSYGGLVEPDGEIAAMSGAHIEYEYEKDAHGNWISRTETISGAEGRTISRTITYR